MSAVLESPPLNDELRQVLQNAAQKAGVDGLAFAGSLPPNQAWALVQAGAATLVDVRSPEEYKFVGHVPGSLAVPWASGTSLTRNPRFTRELEAKLGGKHSLVLLLCRSGKRSALAAEAAAKAGFSQVFNVQEGFEGELNEAGQRGHSDGWRARGLPWSQD
jgi:rhodanese-related sulfurtransferase